MRTLIILVGGVVAFVGLILFIDNQSTTAPPTQTDQEESGKNQDTVSWQSYESTVSPGIQFSVQYPPQVTISQVQDTIYEIKFVGPDSEPNTEITDGYYASLMFREASDIETYIQEQNPDTRIQTIPFNGRDGLTFTTESELGNQKISHIAYRLFPESDWILDIGYATYGEDSTVYRDELLKILKTINITRDGNSTGEQTTLEIAMLDYDQLGKESDGPSRGCDRVVFVEKTIPATTTPLNASLHALFAYEDTEVGGWQNFIAKTNDTLFFEKAVLEDRVASIYLTGELSGLAGVCDNPRTRIQIEETVLQFDTVDEVVLYLNGEETELQPSGRGD